MKKMMMAVICMAIVSMNCMAKNNGNMGRNNVAHETKVEKNVRGGNDLHIEYRTDMIIDMNAIHRLDLSRNEMKRVENLKERCDKEMRRLYAKHDERMIRKATEKYEKELKGIIGRDNYKRYEWLTNGNLAMNDRHDKGFSSGGNNHRNDNITITSVGRK